MIKPRYIIASILLLVSILLPQTGAAIDKNKIQSDFNKWKILDLWPEAQSRGVSSILFKRSMSGIKIQWKLPDLIIPGTRPKTKRAQSQAEFRGPAAYFSPGNLKTQANKGRALYKKWQTVLRKIERKYGVPGRFLIAIWGRESAFGNAKIPYSALRVLATKAYMSTRKPLFREELLAALQILQKGQIKASSLKGSWAGALGQPQFMPTSFLKYAVDFDGDGRKDIWGSVPDTLASMANYLAKNGWQAKRDWGFEVIIPNNLSCASEGPDRARKISYWRKQNVKRVSGKPFPLVEQNKKAMMLVPAGRHGPHFIVTENFYVIKQYNNSDLYALYVGNLADRIAYGAGPFITPWQRQDKMLRSQISSMQQRMEKLGYEVGGADGLPGFKTRRSIGEWQARHGRSTTCFPDADLIRNLR